MTKESNYAKNAVKSIMKRKISTGLVEHTLMSMVAKFGGAAVNAEKNNPGASFLSISARRMTTRMKISLVRRVKAKI